MFFANCQVASDRQTGGWATSSRSQRRPAPSSMVSMTRSARSRPARVRWVTPGPSRNRLIRPAVTRRRWYGRKPFPTSVIMAGLPCGQPESDECVVDRLDAVVEALEVPVQHVPGGVRVEVTGTHPCLAEKHVRDQARSEERRVGEEC